MIVTGGQYRYDRLTMFVRRPRLGWLPLVQLLIAGCLLLAAINFYFTDHYAAIDAKTEQRSEQQQRRMSATPAFTLPAGGRNVFPGHRLIALYGTPNAPVLGSLGHQNLASSIARIRKISQQYQPYSTEKILPTFEIIATIASEFPTENNDYSREIDQDVLREWIDAARKAGIYVILDLQPGRTDFLTQAKRLRPLLLEPNVGLALDAEWRLKPNQIPLVQIGSVSIDEVNRTAAWLANLTKAHHLPQKVFLLHQFRNDMLPNRDQLHTQRRELAYAIQMDGQGTQSQKQDTWHAILRQPPANTKFGWKNFYVKDTTLLSPKQTMQVRPKPWLVTYQ